MSVPYFVNVRQAADGRYVNDVEHRHIGLTLADTERNHYHDSYFDATVWDVEAGKSRSFQYGTTAGPTPRSCTVDAEPCVLAAYQSEVEIGRASWAVVNQRERCAKPLPGAKVIVARGRKVAKGTTGVVFGEPQRRAYGWNNPRVYVWVKGADAAFQVDAANLDVVEPTLDDAAYLARLEADLAEARARHPALVEAVRAAFAGRDTTTLWTYTERATA